MSIQSNGKLIAQCHEDVALAASPGVCVCRIKHQLWKDFVSNDIVECRQVVDAGLTGGMQIGQRLTDGAHAKLYADRIQVVACQPG